MQQQNILYSLREEFNKVVKSIYVDPESKYFILDEEGNKIWSEKISFSVEMCFDLLMSQYFKNVKIKFGGELMDLRISFFLILPSRMGKGQLIKVVESIGKKLGLKVKRVSYLNQASLIGSISQYAIEYNIKHKLMEGMKGYINPIIYGVLAKYDILIFPEAKKLVKGVYEGETEFILSTLQEALDYPGLIDKTMKDSDYPIQYESTVSIFGTTYYIKEISELLLEQGFFQRIIIYKKNLSIEEVKELRKEIIEKFKDKNIKDFKTLSKEFSQLILEYSRDEKILTFTDEAIKELHKFNESYFDKIKNISGTHLEILKSFSQTIIQMVVKISGINCCLRKDNKINLFDIVTSINTFKSFTRILIDELIIEDKKRNQLDELKSNIIHYFNIYLKENTYSPSKTEFRKYLNTKGIGSSKAFKVIEYMIQQNYFKIKEVGKDNKQLLYLISDDKNEDF